MCADVLHIESPTCSQWVLPPAVEVDGISKVALSLLLDEHFGCAGSGSIVSESPKHTMDNRGSAVTKAEQRVRRLLDGLSSLIDGELEQYQRVQFRRRRPRAAAEPTMVTRNTERHESEARLHDYLHFPIVPTDHITRPTGDMSVVLAQYRDIYFSGDIITSEEERQMMRSVIPLDEAWGEMPPFPRSKSTTSAGLKALDQNSCTSFWSCTSNLTSLQFRDLSGLLDDSDSIWEAANLVAISSNEANALITL